ncbi:MAG: dockerin type I domain-containing protein [Acidobacteria bacterium]|nr:dockerin type I domain-containing protein [Acidobacteriota bacterium]
MKILRSLFTLLAVSAGCLLAQPQVYELTFTPATVADAALPTSMAASLKVYYPVTTSDDWAELILETPGGSSTMSGSVNTTFGIPCPAQFIGGYCLEWVFDFTVDTIFTAGVYSPTAVVYYFDLSGNYLTLNLNPAQLAAAGVSSTFTITAPGGGGGGGGGPTCSVPPVAGGSPVIAISDTTPPQLVDETACVTPSTVDVRTASQTVTYSFRIKDDLAGFAYGYINLFAPNSGQSFYQFFYPWQRVSGNEWDGTYEVTFTIPMGATPGTWTANMQLRDAVGNWNYLWPKSPADPTNPAGFEVISTEDTAPPAIPSIVFSPTSVNVSAASQVVTLDVRLTDAGTGVDLSKVYLGVDGPTTTGRTYQYATFVQTLSGDSNDGVHRFQVTVPRYAPAGAWRLRAVQLSDLAGNNAYLDRDYNPTGLPTTSFTVVSSPADSAAPQITSLSLSPAFVNASASSQTVTVTATITDNLSGIQDQYSCPIYLRSPSGQQEQGAYLIRQSGTPVSGVFKADVVLPQYSETGTWRPGYLYCNDGALNQLLIASPSDFIARFPTAKVDVYQPSLVNDGTLAPSGSPTIISDTGSTTVLTFPPNAVTGSTQVAVDVLSQPPNIPTPAGFSRGSSFVSVELTPKATAPFPAPGVTLVMPLETQLPAGSTLLLYKVDTTTGRLVPAPRVSPPGGQVEGVVDPTGLKATFTGISGFSTVVGLFPSGRPGDLNNDNQVNCEDIKIIRDSWNKRQGQRGFDDRADFNKDRVINLLDLAGVSRYLPKRTRCN